MSILEDLGLTQADIDAGEASTIVKEFKAMPSGIYEGKVKDIIVFKNQWDGSQMRYNVTVKNPEGDEVTLTFRSDIGKTLKDGSANKGYAGRLEQFLHATNTQMGDINVSGDIKIKSFGKEVDGKYIKGMDGKVIKVLVRHTDDTAKAEGESFKHTNDVQGVLAPDGTEKGGADGATEFTKAVEKHPVFSTKGKTKAASSTTTAAAATTASGQSVNDML